LRLRVDSCNVFATFLGDNRAVRVLLIEDDHKLARLVASVLNAEGMDVDVARDGDEGLEYILRDVYEVAVVDWMLPGRDGPSICRGARANKLQVAILMLTARGQLEDRVVGLDSGADDYLVSCSRASGLSPGAPPAWPEPTHGSYDTPTSSWTCGPVRCGEVMSPSTSRPLSGVCSSSCSATPAKLLHAGR
jgi:CheY-like chemotaxis protein